MSFEVRKAERKKAKLKLGISGPSGAGKTFSALTLASGITGNWEKITLIDTENGSGELYSHLGPYNVISFEAPFSPERYVQAIQAAVKSGAEVVVIDSISHEWDGKGGCLDIQTQLGGRYQDWAKVTPKHDAFVHSILQSPCHMIVTTRKKQDYELTKGSDGKAKVQKVGMKEIQRDGFEYELTINFDVEINHFATTSKDRTGLFMPRGSFQITAEIGKELAAWATSGADRKSIEIPKVTGLSTSIAATSKTTISSPPTSRSSMPVRYLSNDAIHAMSPDSERNNYKVSFGKYVGRSLSEIPTDDLRSYLDWIKSSERSTMSSAALEFEKFATLELAAR